MPESASRPALSRTSRRMDCGPCSWTTSSSPATSSAICSGRSAASRSSARPATASRRSTTIDRLQPDLVFLDVQMPGLTGFEVARRLLDDGPASHIIFVTAFDQHAIEAFEVNAVDYLLKPVDPARLEMALQRARRRIAAERQPAEPTAGAVDGAPTSSRRSSSWSPNGRAAASGWRSRSASGFCWCRRKKFIYASLADEASPS